MLPPKSYNRKNFVKIRPPVESRYNGTGDAPDNCVAFIDRPIIPVPTQKKLLFLGRSSCKRRWGGGEESCKL